ncbi:MAG: DUF4349 domain-containing protein [Phycisphaerales bacterium]|nr:DUF4349 domain-containing protein [Phycisphaerales bacterium]
MTINSPADLEDALRSLTEWSGEYENLWRKAIGALPPRRSRFARFIAARPFMSAAAACVVLAFTAALVSLFTPSLLRARDVALQAPAAGEPAESGFLDKAWLSRSERTAYGTAQPEYKLRVGVADQALSEQEIADRREPTDAARQVIRKASVEVKTADVRSVQLRMAHLIHEGAGEFIQDSSTSGDGANMQAHLTLRIAADRLGAVLTEIREFGEVLSEKLEGEDVTGQVVDLDARLSNEERVEDELLELLASKKDAPLTDIMAVRTSLGQVRQSIEQMRAQRQRLDKLVSLATVLVIIRHASEPPAPQPTGLGAYFMNQLSNAWNHALRRLADTVVGLMWLLVSGAVWWLLLLLALWAVARKIAHGTKACPSPGA